jgi:long-chain acyl-CoA synthetase
VTETIPDRPHLASLLDDFRRHGNGIAFVTREGLRTRSSSYAEVAELATRFAAELATRGIVKGDRVLIWGENSAEWVAALFGCVLRGVIAVPIDFHGSAQFANRVACDVSPSLAVGARERLRLLETANFPQIAFQEFTSHLSRSPASAPIEGLTEDDPLQIIFTSGTTGEPKGVVHSHRNILASLRPMEREIRKYLKYERPFHPLRFLHTLPLSHVFGEFMGIWIPVLLAAEVHFAQELLPADMVGAIRRERVSVLVTVPRVLEILRTHLLASAPDLSDRLQREKSASAWRRWWVFRDIHRAFGFKFWALICGGATLPAELEGFWRSLGFVLVQGYGMTETGALVSVNHPFRVAGGTLGKVLPGREIRLTPEGEIQVRGETVSGATWEQGRLRPRSSEWLETGDLAMLDPEGNLKFRGRKKEVIVTASGLNIYPEDLEAALLKQPEVRGAAVVEFAAPSGPEPAAALLLRGASDPARAVEAANRELAEFQQIRRWIVWPDHDFPRTSTGKTMHPSVAATVHQVLSSSGSAPTALRTLISRLTGEDASKVSDTALLSEDLHLDSLGRVELQGALESELGVPMEEAAFQQVRSVRDLQQLVADAAVGAERVTPQAQHFYPEWPWTWLANAVRIVFIEGVVCPLVALLADPKVAGRRGADVDEPLLIVSNHVTIYDVPLILFALGRARRKVAVAMSAELLQDLRRGHGHTHFLPNIAGPLEYWIATGLFNVFPLPQTGNFRRSFQHAGHAMDRGFHVLVFPEGRRTPDGQMHAFQAGSGILWQDLRSKALPVHLGGLEALAKGKRGWFRSGRMKITVGAPLPLDDSATAAEAAGQLEQAVGSLNNESSESLN